MHKQRPLSRAYRSFYSAGKEDGGVVVHLGSGAAAANAGGAAVPSAADGANEAVQGNLLAGAGGQKDERDGEEGVGGADDIFEGGFSCRCFNKSYYCAVLCFVHL